jgi:hypothetical protein
MEPKQITFLYAEKPDHPWAEVPEQDELPAWSAHPTTNTSEATQRMIAAFIYLFILNIKYPFSCLKY